MKIFIAMTDRRNFIKKSMFATAGITAGIPLTMAGITRQKADPIRIGIIGLDTSHSPAFTKYINDPKNTKMKGAKVVAAYPYGSTRIESSASRIPEYTKEIKTLGVEILDSLEDLIDQVDAILLETNDGTLHLEQATPVIETGKPLFIDKPVAANLVDVIRIYENAKEHQAPLFSSSSLRYIPKAQEVRHQQIIGEVTGADTYSPEHWEPSHTDLYWYGIHGVEILYTIMNTGCQRIRRILTDNTDLVIGEWAGDRLGTFRGDLQGHQAYGGTAFGTKGVVDLGSFEGYGPLVDQIVEFFKTGESPVDPAETIELYTFMEAADVCKQRHGEWVELAEIYENTLKVVKI
jgi:predicted dehydrogenase